MTPRRLAKQVAQLVLVAGELVGGMSWNWKPSDLNALHQHEVERDAGDHAGGVADGDEPTAPAQRAQCGFRQVATDRVDDGVGAVGQCVAQRGAQITGAVIDEMLRTV